MHHLGEHQKRSMCEEVNVRNLIPLGMRVDLLLHLAPALVVDIDVREAAVAMAMSRLVYISAT